MSRLSQTKSARRYYHKQDFIERICKCGCGEIFYTKNKKSIFKNIYHYNNFRKIKHIKKGKNKPKRYKVQKKKVFQTVQVKQTLS